MAALSLNPRVVVAWAAASVSHALAVAADRLDLPTLPSVGRLCPTCGSDRHGQPFLPGLDHVHLSISRSPGGVAVAVSLGARVGVDVEPVGVERFLGLAEVLLHPLEAMDGPDDAAVTWVRKEAVVKAWGSGLVVDPRSIRLSRADEQPVLLSAPPAFDGLATRLVDLVIPGVVGCLAVVSPTEPDLTVLAAAPAALTRAATPRPGA